MNTASHPERRKQAHYSKASREQRQARLERALRKAEVLDGKNLGAGFK